MNATTAFDSDPSRKQDLLDRIDRHLAAETLTFMDTAWDGTQGSPLGVSIEGVDPADYATRYGYPLSLAALLDPLLAYPADTFDAAGFVRDWVAVVRPGADLSRVPAELMLFMLGDPAVSAYHAGLTADLMALHRRDRDGDTPPRPQWATARKTILTLPAASSSPALALLEAASWPAASGRSSLTSAFEAWRRLQAVFDDPTWSREDEVRKEELLHAIWEDVAPARDAGEQIDYHAQLLLRDADLADRFLGNLNRGNALFLNATASLATVTLEALERQSGNSRS